MCWPTMETLPSSAGSMPLTWIGCIAPLYESMPSISVIGAAAITAGLRNAASATVRQSSSGLTPRIAAWGTRPRMRELISRWKPFITDSTTIMASTPSDRPIIEVMEMNEMK